MFENKDENINAYYTDAVKDAVINNTNNKKISDKIFLILSLTLATAFLVGISYFVYNFLTGDSDSSEQKRKVMGVTHIAKDDKVLTQSDIDYAIEIERLDNPTMDSEYNEQLSKYLLNKKREKDRKE